MGSKNSVCTGLRLDINCTGCGTRRAPVTGSPSARPGQRTAVQSFPSFTRRGIVTGEALPRVRVPRLVEIAAPQERPTAP